MMAMQERMPYVQFSRAAVEVRAPAMLPDGTVNPKAGEISFKDVDYVTITQTGGKDTVTKAVEDWLAQMAMNVNAGRTNPDWLRQYKLAYKEFQDGQTTPLNGIPIKNWPVLTPAEVANLTRLHVHCVEDLAVANEQTLAGLGMGGRALKQKAIDYLQMKQESGPVLEQLNAFRIQMEAQERMLKDLNEKNTRQEIELNFFRNNQAARVASNPEQAAPNHGLRDPLERLAEQRAGNDFDDLEVVAP